MHTDASCEYIAIAAGSPGCARPPATETCVTAIDYGRPALARASPFIDALGAAEDLPAHVAAVRARIPR
jgi:hypothetical protein